MENSNEAKTVHFSLGERTGILLAQIAQEHLLYNNDPKKAVETISKSLMGIDIPTSLKILKGDLVLHVDNNEMIAADYDESIHKGIFPQLECSSWSNRRAKEIISSAYSLRAGLETATQRMQYKGGLAINFPYDSIIEFLNGDDKEVLEEILDNDQVTELNQLITATKMFLEKSVKELDTYHFMKRTWPDEYTEADEVYPNEARQLLKQVMDLFAQMMRTDYAQIATDSTSDLDSFLTAVHEIDKIIDRGITPVEIMDNYSAGWLSPEGDYYALNGEIANLLHNQIADALVEKGIIPTDGKWIGNPDNWLQANGWVRVHRNEINFEGHMNERISRGDNVFMTDKQIDMLTEYCRLHHKGVIKVFFQAISALQFQTMIKNHKIGFYQKYLNW